MRTVIVGLFAAISLAGASGCESQAESNKERPSWLTHDGVLLHSAAQVKQAVALPGWVWVAEPLCPPDLAVGPDGEAVVTSNVVSMLWRIDPKTRAVTVHDLKLDADADKDVGFAALVYSPEHAAYFGYSESQRSVWKIDRQLSHATKVGNADLGRARPCTGLGRELSRFVALTGAE